MAKKDKDSKSSVTQPEEILKNYLDETSEYHYNFHESIEYVVSTGSLKLDVELGGGLGPGVHRLVGESNVGKTAETMLIMENFLRTVPNARGVYIRAEGRGLTKKTLERANFEITNNWENWKDGNCFVFKCNRFEPVMNLLRKLVRDNASETKYCFVIDSTDALVLLGDADKELDENAKVAGSPALSKRFLQTMALEMIEKGHMVLMIGQVTAEVKLDPYAKTPNRGGNFSGGNALLHWSDFILEFQTRYQGDVILDPPTGKMNDGKSKMLGHWCKIVLKKSSNENKFKSIEYPVKYGRKAKSGVWAEYEIVDLLLQYEMASKSGAWINIDADLIKEVKSATGEELKAQHQGADNFREYLEGNQVISDYLFNKLKSVLIS
jgi:RecA/RadA recombinase